MIDARGNGRSASFTACMGVARPPLLLAMQRIIGSIEVERDLAGRSLMRIERQIDEQPIHRLRVVADAKQLSLIRRPDALKSIRYAG